MNDTIIKVDGIGKKFCKTLKHTMQYGACDLARSFLGMSQTAESLREGEFWALQDVSFELKRGECLGLVGANGAGKSTLLKILNGIMSPDRGQIEMHGRVGALIEVGAGFHPLLTGRENIYVNGAILGFSKKEINSKFDEIVEFSGLHEFIDSPVKHYSSGMYVRLGFAIAAQMEPDVLIIDEVIAVGDAGFRSKCYNRIAKISENTAIILVSHSMPMISRLATSAMVLDRGYVKFKGDSVNAILEYNRLFTNQMAGSRSGSGSARIQSLRFLNDTGCETTRFQYGAPFFVELRVMSEINIGDVCIDLVFLSISDEVVAECNNITSSVSIDLLAGEELLVKACISELSLNAGIYKISALLQSRNMMTHYDWLKDVAAIEVAAERVGVAGQQFKAIWETSVV